MQYVRLNQDLQSIERILELSQEQYAALDGNPKQVLLRPLVVDPQPAPSATQVVSSAGYVIEQTQVRQTLALRGKSADELDAAAREGDRVALVQLISALTASIQAHTATPDTSGTAAERLVKLESRVLDCERRTTRVERIARHYLQGETR